MAITFGYCVEAPLEWPALLELARQIDQQSNFEQLWVTDGFLPNGPPDAPRLDGWTALAALAALTSRVRLGVLVTGNPYRHPALLAKIATTVDHISSGRLEFGIGSGWPGENTRFGTPFGSRPERLERLDEALQVIKLLWTQARPLFHGRHFRLDEPSYQPANVQRPHPPIVVGGSSEPILRIVARHAGACNVSGDPEQARRQFTRIEELCREYDRDPSAIRRTTELPVLLSDDPAFVRRAMEWWMATYGGTEESVRKTSIVGSASDVKERIEGLADAGMQEIILFQLPRVHLQSLLRFSDEVIPAFR